MHKQQVLIDVEEPLAANAALEAQTAVRRHITRKGQSAAYRRDQARRVMTLHRLGFPWAQFWACITRREAEAICLDWLEDMQDLGKRRGALNNYRKLLNLVGHQILDIDGFHIALSPTPRRQLIALTHGQHLHVLDNYRHAEEGIMVRNLAIYAVSILVDARRAEPTRLQLDHLDPDGRRVFVKRSKNGVAQWTPVKDDLWIYIQDWLDIRPTPDDNPLALFTTIRHPIKALQPAGVYAALRSMGRQLGLKLNSTVTRHTAQKRKADVGISVPTRRWAGGWLTDKSPAIYDEQGFDEAAREIHAAAPGLRENPQERSVGPVGGRCPTCKQGWPGIAE